MKVEENAIAEFLDTLIVWETDRGNFPVESSIKAPTCSPAKNMIILRTATFAVTIS